MKKARRFSLLVVTLIALASMLALHARPELKRTATGSRPASRSRLHRSRTGSPTSESSRSSTPEQERSRDSDPRRWCSASRRTGRSSVWAWELDKRRHSTHHRRRGHARVRELAYVCQTASGPVATSTWTVDGASSTGAFADARGSGEGSVDLATRTRPRSPGG